MSSNQSIRTSTTQPLSISIPNGMSDQQHQQMLSASTLCTPHLSLLKLDTDPSRLAFSPHNQDVMSPTVMYSNSFHGNQIPLTPPGSTLFSSPYSAPLSAGLEGPVGGFSYMDQLTQGLSIPSASSLIRGDDSPHPLMAGTPTLPMLSLPHLQNWMVGSPIIATTPISPLESDCPVSMSPVHSSVSMSGMLSSTTSVSNSDLPTTTITSSPLSSTVAPIPIKGKAASKAGGGKIPSRLSTVTPPRTPSVASPRKRASAANASSTAEKPATSSPMSAEVRKAVHKMSEQRRREQLKSCFDQLLSLIPVDTQANPLASLERQPNRVEILRRTLDYLHDLRNQNSSLISRVQELESKMGVPSSIGSMSMPIPTPSSSAAAMPTSSTFAPSQSL